MPVNRDEEKDRDAPRTDLPPAREPYYEGYFGTDEEEGAERETNAEDEERRRRADPEESAGGDREI